MHFVTANKFFDTSNSLNLASKYVVHRGDLSMYIIVIFCHQCFGIFFVLF